MNRDTNLPIDTDPTPHVERLHKLLDYLEPVDSPTDEQAAVLARVADALTIEQVEVLGDLIEGIRGNANEQGVRDFIALVERDLAAREDTE